MRAYLATVTSLMLLASALTVTSDAGRGNGAVRPSVIESTACFSVESRPLSRVLHGSGDTVRNQGVLPEIDQRIEQALLRGLIEWIGAHSKYDVSAMLANLPAIVFCSIGETVDYEGRHLIVEDPLVAAYDSRRRLIFLVEPWDRNNLRDVARLLHELIHDVQYRSRTWRCWGDAEREAYKMQEEWLVSRGLKPDFDWFAIYLKTKCRRDIHP